ncbi:guanylate cyclase 32E-like isoform X3 [Ruditapes philippinarum]|uniref:guanylate cyclase 32E-like isoform X3 n=1 Tax=Ruditapes philippinarum TaxID=129788 RepID=UPI00295ABCD7|nr:guanylate cyclase 32E-like isoform X3 [Ruditapes philippinarum]
MWFKIFHFLTLTFVAYLSYVCPDGIKTLKISFLCSSKSPSKLFAGAFFEALDYVNNNTSMLNGYKLECLFKDTNGSSLTAINAMTDHYEMDVVGFIGPDKSCHCEATVASAWNLPMIVYKCHDSKFGKLEMESKYRRTFARTQPSTSKVSKSIMSILQYYEWKRFTLVVGASSIWNETAESLKDLSTKNNIYVNKVAYYKEPYSFNLEMYYLVESTHKDTRIYVFLGDIHALIDFSRLLKAMLHDSISEYVVIAVDERFYKDDPAEYLIKKPFENETALTIKNIQSFETVLLLVPRPPENNKTEEFFQQVRERNTEPPISSNLRPIYNGIPVLVPVYAAYLYDAVYTYARALEEVLKEGGKPNNGTAIIDKIRDRSFKSILGYDVYVDIYGDAEGNYTLLTFDVHRDEGGVELVPAGNFSMTRNGTGIPSLHLFKNIKWKNGKPPPDRPACGFHGEKCIQEFEWRILAVCIVVAVICLIAGGFFLRHYLYEQKLARLLWKVDFKDIVLVDSVDDIIPPTRKKRKRSKNQPFKFIFSYESESERSILLEESKRERSTCSDTNKRNLIGSFKGTIVAVKHIIRKSVEIDRDMRKHLQLRKELNHDNIARFLGACVDVPHIYILTQYCQRGSLHDILQNEDFSLDDMFISSLVSDLLKAMSFIHDSEIGSHGNLKSSNCVIDARWVLMVSDFGLHKLDNERSDSITDRDKYYDRLLWKAPELLRSSVREVCGTQKGDVYAFAIILYEMMGRNGPWGETQYSSREIIDIIKQGDKDLRPDLTRVKCETFVKDCIEECWREEPEHRPDFKTIRFRLKHMLQGIKSNIFDNMLDMMEKYATNLENLVAERTELLSEEKKMTENLLLRMLPVYVADRLKRGEPVVPELYDCVSIYFSDIVGFTALSAESTPMEVVCMLNELYTCFDAIVENYDVYKIETIGDAYFVVSGLPLRNGNLHAGEIASMSLHMLREIMNFKISHRPSDTLKLRIGIHSGPCVAGVVGLKMPRYTIFGDTVNTASRMESTGVPLKIHCSSTITQILRELGGYQLTERGYITAKGKGEMLTYFLEGENESHRQRRISHSKFSRSNSPNVDSRDIFGQPTIHQKYWQNGSIPSPTKDLDNAPFQNCDIVRHEYENMKKQSCDSDTNFDDIFNAYFDGSSDEGASTSHHTNKAYSEQCIHKRPKQDKNRSTADRQQSVNLPLLSCNGGTNYIHDDKNNGGFRKNTKLELSRNVSCPTYSIVEEDTV